MVGRPSPTPDVSGKDIMRQTCRILLFAWLLVSAAGCRTPIAQAPRGVPKISSASDKIQEVRLDDLNLLVVRRDGEDHRVAVEIVFADKIGVVKNHTIRNALVEGVSVEAVQCDPSNDDTEYLIRIPDRSSTFGAVTGIIAYRLQWWEFLIIPDDRFRVQDIDTDGVAELMCDRIQKRTYSLFRGVLHEKGC